MADVMTGFALTGLDWHLEVATGVFEQLAGWAADALPDEAAGLLLGRVREDGRVEVVAPYPLTGGGASPSAMSLPAEVWIKAHWDTAQAHPDLVWVGWFHTHPGHGVFLSVDDWDLHRRKFAPEATPFASAWVLDPVAMVWGAYLATPDDPPRARLMRCEPDAAPGIYTYVSAL